MKQRGNISLLFRLNTLEINFIARGCWFKLSRGTKRQILADHHQDERFSLKIKGIFQVSPLFHVTAFIIEVLPKKILIWFNWRVISFKLISFFYTFYFLEEINEILIGRWEDNFLFLKKKIIKELWTAKLREGEKYSYSLLYFRKRQVFLS